MITDILASSLLWCARKFTGIVIITVLMLAVLALSIFLRDDLDVEQRRAENLKVLRAKRAELARAAGEIDQRAVNQRHGVQVLETRARLAREELDALREQQSVWKRWFGDREKQKAIDAEIARLTRVAADAGKSADDIRRRRGQVKWERDGVEIELEQVNAAIAREEGAPGPLLHYFGRAWDAGKRFVFIGVPVYLFAPLAWTAAKKLRRRPA